MQRRELQTVLIALGAIVLAAVAIAATKHSAPKEQPLSASSAPSTPDAAAERALSPLSGQPPSHAPALGEAGAVARNDAFSVRVVSEFGDVALSEGVFHVMVEVEALEHDQALERLPTDVIVLLDSSGSMEGNKFANAKAAIRALHDALEPTDTISVVRFSHDAEAIVRRHTVSDNGAPFTRALERVQAQGGTCISCGLDEAEKLMRADRPSRLILISDGHPTVGGSDARELAHRVAQMREAHRFTAAALGVGRDVDGALLAAIAERGNGGRYTFLRNSSAIARVIQAEVARMEPALMEQAEVALELQQGVLVNLHTRWFTSPTWHGLEPTWTLGAMRPGERRRIVVPITVADHVGLPRVTARVTTDGARGPRVARRSVRYTSVNPIAPSARAWEVSAEVARRRAEHAMGAALELMEHGNRGLAARKLTNELAAIETLRRHGQHEAVAPTAANLTRLLDSLDSYQSGSDTLLAERLNFVAGQREVRMGMDDSQRYNVFGADMDCELE